MVLSQAALFAGAVVSTIACATVVVKYVRHPSVRRRQLQAVVRRVGRAPVRYGTGTGQRFLVVGEVQKKGYVN